MQKFLKYFAILLLVPAFVGAFTLPVNPTGFVQDYASLLTADQKATLETKLQNYEKNTTNEIAVVTIPSLDGDTIENVAQEIFTKWGIGKADKDNGVLLLISLAEHKTRIHTGYGVEGDLTDIGTSYIQSEVVSPAFKAGDYNAGINGAVDKMIEALGGTDIVPENFSTKTKSIPWNILLIGFIFFIQIVTSILAQSKSWWGGGVLGGIIAAVVWHFFIASLFLAVPLFLGLVGFGLLFDYFVSRSYGAARSTGSYPWWLRGGGGGFGGRGGGGGFGGFGGGSSGGGGSSSSW